MKHKLLFLLLLLPIQVFGKDAKLEEAQQMAQRYYSLLGEIANQPTASRGEFVKRLESITGGTDRNGKDVEDQFQIPNDLDAIFGTASYRAPTVSVEDYVTKIREYAVSANLRMEFKILSCKYLKGPSTVLDKKKESPYIEIRVKRFFFRDGKAQEELEEWMRVKVDTKCPFVDNKYGDVGSGKEILLAEAFGLYRQRKYEEAFKRFEKVMELDPTNAEASYRLGVMLYKKQGCMHKYWDKGYRNRTIYKYWQMSEKGRRAHLYYSDNRF